MRVPLPVTLFAILLGAVEVAGGAQELIFLGILRSRTYPLTAGTLGTVAGAFLLWAGIALLINSPLAPVLVRATAYVSLPVFVMIGILTRVAGWPITAVGIGFPLLLLFLCRKNTTPYPAT